MSLITDRIFYAALSADSSIMERTQGRIFNPARSTVDETEDRIPYVILTFEGLNNQPETKDEEWESDEDSVTIGILCVDTDREALGDLCTDVRQCIDEYFSAHEDEELVPIEYTLQAGPVSYDPDKPCVFQTLTYQCITNK